MSGAGRRLGWAFADQALSSCSNFLLTFGVLHVTTQDSLGRFGLFFLCFTLTLTASRAAAADIVTARASDLDAIAALSFADSRRPVAALIGFLGALGTAGVLVSSGTDGIAWLLLGASSFPLLAVQDYERYVAMTSGRPQRAAASDAVWLGVLAALLLGGWATGRPATLGGLIVAWSVAGGLAALLGLRMNRAKWVAPSLVRATARRDAKLRQSFVTDALAYMAGGPGVLLVMGLLVGVGEFAAVAVAQTLLSPLNVVIGGASLFVAAEARRRRAHSAEQRRLLIGGGLCLASAIWVYAATLLTGPTALFETLFGRDPAGDRRFVVAFAAYLSCSALLSGAAVGIRVGPAPRTAATIRTASSLLALAATTTAASQFGALGALWCWAAVTLTFVPAWWVAYWRSRRTAESFSTLIRVIDRDTTSS